MDDANFKSALRIALLSGGDSPEREISLASGNQAERALVEAGYHCERFDPAAIDLSMIDWAAFEACFIALPGDEQISRQTSIDRLRHSDASVRFVQCAGQSIGYR
jgi:D-alanine-D-alanine ligase-like ATP-grasp enzyme